jgi:hypothetical protein
LPYNYNILTIHGYRFKGHMYGNHIEKRECVGTWDEGRKKLWAGISGRLSI